MAGVSRSYPAGAPLEDEVDPFIYQYLVGGLIFAVGLAYAWRQGVVGLRGAALRNGAVAVGGLLFFAALQGYLQYGDMETAERIGPAVSERSPLCPYPCEERFPADAPEQARSPLELEKIASILTVERDLKAARANRDAGALSAEQFAAAEAAVLDRRQLGTSLDYSIMVAYFILMLVIGTWFGRNNKNTKDFFFGGQRFSWWLISFSLVATTVGSYSFVKYSKVAFGYGIASSQTYLNDWFWMPFLVFGWLPILYFSRLVSIPEYFERRYNLTARRIATYLILAYLVGYVGINLFTMGKALNALIGWPIFGAAMGVATISAAYVTFGGQTSVIMTDLFQGVMLLATGMVLLWLGMDYLGGPGAFWESLPRSHRTAFVGFNEGGAIYGKAGDASYHSVGIFWQDAIANSAMFYFLNQGMVMRLMAARSVKDSRRSVLSMFLILMPVAAVVVASGGWVGKALVHSGAVPAEMEASRAFYDAAYILTQPGIFGLIMAALTAALMSTVDTLVTAVSAIVVNDIYKPRKPQATEAELLSMARKSAFGVMVFGVALVPLFASFDSIYSAHGAFTAAMTPPLVVTLLLGIFWRGFPARVAVWTMVGGMAAIVLSLFVPEVIAPFAHGVPAREAGEGLFGGMDTYKFMRAFFGIVVCLGIALIGTLITGREDRDDLGGLVWGTIRSAIASYKGSEGDESESAWAQSSSRSLPDEEAVLVEGRAHHPTVGLPYAWVSAGLAGALGGLQVGDLLYVSDRRAWLGGLRSAHVLVGEIREGQEQSLGLPESVHSTVVSSRRADMPIRVKRLY